MKKIIFYLFTLCYSISGHSQELPVIDDNIRIAVDTSLMRVVLEEMKERAPLLYEKRIKELSQADIDQMHVLNYIYLSADTINNRINCEVDSTSFLIYFPQKKDLYILDTSSRYLAPIDYGDTKSFLSTVSGQIQSKFECAFCLFFFPREINRHLILGFKGRDGNYAFKNTETWVMSPSLSYLLSFHFGSPQNYIDTYKFRSHYREDSYKFKKRILGTGNND